jgi:alanyl-tRNA synthetase
LVAADRLRFDFNHFTKVEINQIIEIERQVNEKIQEDLPVQIVEDSFESAKSKGAMALFGEKYADVVRTVRVPGFSFELCGGTHVKRTGQIGAFIIIYEGSIAAGIRRIEAITGQTAMIYMQNNRNLISRLAEIVNASETDLAEKISEIVESKRKIEKELEKISSRVLSQGIDQILATAEEINGIKVISYSLPNGNLEQLKEIGDQIREKTTNTIALLGTVFEEKISFVCTVSDDLIKTRGLKAGDLIQKIARLAGGGGGGRPHMATAGAKDISRYEAAMAEIKNIV